MDTTLQQLLTLASEGTIERRCAALLVLGALKLSDDRTVDVAGAALEQVNVLVRDYALRYFEDIRPKAGLSSLTPLLDNADKDAQERVIRLLISFGQAAVRPVLHHAKVASRIGQINAARVLCAVRGKTAWKGLLSLLSQGDSEFNKTVCDLMTTVVHAMDEQEQEEFFTEVETFAETLDLHAQRPAVISAIRLLGQLGQPRARKRLFGFVGADHHHSIRFHTVVALLHCLRGQELRKEEFVQLLAVLEEPEFSDVVRLTLELLDAHTLPQAYAPVLSRLLDSSHIAVQKFALRKMGEFDSPEVVRTLVEQLSDPDAARRDTAARSLRKIPTARSALIKEFLRCDDPGKAWAIADILPGYEGKWRRATLDAIWDRLQAAVLADERIHGAYLHFLKRVDADYVYAQLAVRGAQLVKAKQYREALKLLTLLKDFPTLQPEDRFRLALAQLKLHPLAVAPLAQRQGAALELLADLDRSSAFPLLEALKKEKTLEPEELFALGFHFAEGAPTGRALGKDILELLVIRYPRTKIGKSAKNKLALLASPL